MKSKIIICLSGGVDSTTLLHMAKAEGFDPIVLTSDYGQLHEKEVSFAVWQANKLNVPLYVVDLKPVFAGMKTCSLLQSGTEPVPEGDYASQIIKDGKASTYVPNRNMILLSCAAAIAIENKAEWVGYAAHGDDVAGHAYPDCSVEFVECMGKTLETQGIKLYTPFVPTHGQKSWNKASIIKRGLELGVDYSHTWSCYNGKIKPCGVCGTCIDRARAFEANGVVDPLLQHCSPD